MPLDGSNLILQLPRPGEPESAMLPGMAAAAPREAVQTVQAVQPLGMPDTSIGPVALQEPAHWSYDFDPASRISRATYPGLTGGITGQGAVSMNPGAGNVIQAFPVGNSLPTAEWTPQNGILSQFVCQSQTTSQTNPEWAGVFGIWSTTGYAPAAAGAQKVSLYAGAVQSPGSGPVWSLNTLVTRNATQGVNNTPGGPGNIGSGTPGTPGAIPLDAITIGYELDFNNYDQDLPVGVGFGVGMWINMHGSYPATAAIYLSNEYSQSLQNTGWHDGILFAGDHLIKDNTIFDGTHSAYSYQDNGVHGGASYYANDTSPVALAIGGSHSLANIMVNDNAPTVLTIQGSHTHVFDASAATISGAVYNGTFSVSQFLTLDGNLAAMLPPTGLSASFGWNYLAGAGENDYWNNYNGSTVSHTFWQQTGVAGTRLMDISTIGAVTAYGGFVVNAATGPTIRAGPGAATGTQPAGALWLRTDGATGSRLYVSAGGGTWAAVAGV